MTGGPFSAQWQAEAAGRIILSLEFGLADAPTLDTIRAKAMAGQIRLLGELMTQYESIAPRDPRLRV